MAVERDAALRASAQKLLTLFVDVRTELSRLSYKQQTTRRVLQVVNVVVGFALLAIPGLLIQMQATTMPPTAGTPALGAQAPLAVSFPKVMFALNVTGALLLLIGAILPTMTVDPERLTDYAWYFGWIEARLSEAITDITTSAEAWRMRTEMIVALGMEHSIDLANQWPWLRKKFPDLSRPLVD